MRAVILAVTISVIAAIVLIFTTIFFDADSNTYRNESMNPEISSFEEDTYVVWSESIRSEFFDVYFTKITNNDSTGKPSNITQGTSFYPRAQVLASENNVYVIWEDRTDKHGHDGDSIYFKKSNNHGETFDEISVLGTSSLDNVSYTPITLIESGGILYVFMLQWNPQTDETVIVFRSSHDDGDTFGKPVTFFEFDKKSASLFDLLTVDDTVYAVSASHHGHSDESGEVHFRKIHSEGNLGDVINLNKTGHFVNSLDILATENGKNVYVVSIELTDERNPDTGIVLKKSSLFFTKSHDGGNTFDKSVKVNTDSNSGGVETQSIQASSYDEDINLMWNEVYFDENDRFHRTFYAKSNDRGETFDVAVHPLDELRSKYGKIQTYGNDDMVYFVIISKTESFREGGTMYFAKSGDGGMTISQVVDVTGDTLSFFDIPKVSTNENHVHIIADIPPNRNCILYVSSNDAGDSFSKPVNLSPDGSWNDCFTE
ncbi:glycoside hydrolase [archaeon]|nr:glycoside hydrolase [archaeon]